MKRYLVLSLILAAASAHASPVCQKMGDAAKALERAHQHGIPRADFDRMTGQYPAVYRRLITAIIDEAYAMPVEYAPTAKSAAADTAQANAYAECVSVLD